MVTVFLKEIFDIVKQDNMLVFILVEPRIDISLRKMNFAFNNLFINYHFLFDLFIYQILLKFK